MSKIKIQYDEDFKKNAVKLSCASPKSIPDVAADLGIKADKLYVWRKETILPRCFLTTKYFKKHKLVL